MSSAKPVRLSRRGQVHEGRRKLGLEEFGGGGGGAGFEKLFCLSTLYGTSMHIARQTPVFQKESAGHP